MWLYSSSTVVEHSTTNPKIEGSNPSTVNGRQTGKKNDLVKIGKIVEAGEAAKVLVHLDDMFDDGRTLLGLRRPP